MINTVWALVLTGALAFSGVSARLRNLARRLGRSWFLTIGLYMVMYLADRLRARSSPQYSTRASSVCTPTGSRIRRWHDGCGNSFVRLAVDMAVGFALAWVPYLLLARSPRRWWLYTSILSVPFLFVTMLVVPVWIDPLFNKFGPMKNKELEQTILALAGRAGIEGSRVFEVDKSVDTKAVNAYVTGFLQNQAHRAVGHVDRQARRDRGAGRDGPRNGPLRAGPRGAVDSVVVDRDVRRPFPGRLAGAADGRAIYRTALASTGFPTSPRCRSCSCCSSWRSWC